jgi:acyl-coenzyme A synthetase/AMP-(fatty) acid ligase
MNGGGRSFEELEPGMVLWRPAEIIVRDDLPKNESGKIMKQLLRKE